MGVALALFAVSNPVAGSPKFSGWSTPVNLGPVINSVLRENGPAISKDGLSLYFGSAVNTASNDAGPSYFANGDLGVPLLFFGSDRAGGLGGYDIYVSAQQADGSWGAAGPVTELSSSANDQRPSIRLDGLELFFFSDRVGGIGLTDVWVSTRDSTSDPWSPPVNLGSGVNSPQDDTQPFIASDRVTQSEEHT